MQQLLAKISALKNSPVGNVINTKIREFTANNNKSSNCLFNELCFCILTANFNAVRAIKIQNSIEDGFLTLSESVLAQKLKSLGHRFPNVRAKFIVKARKHKNALQKSIREMSETGLREWLVENIAGIGYKEASHFLRNIGYNNSAVIDFHIVDVLVKHHLIKPCKSLNKKSYLEIEALLGRIGKKARLTLAELDLYLWYLETGKVLK